MFQRLNARITNFYDYEHLLYVSSNKTTETYGEQKPLPGCLFYSIVLPSGKAVLISINIPLKCNTQVTLRK